MEPDKYYTPEISEFCVGFEYEIFEDFDYYPEKSWHKQVYGVDGADPERLGYVSGNYPQNFRVKYLDREDIESFGFVKHSGDLDFIKDPFQIEIYPSNVLHITGDCGAYLLHHGVVKNKSELHTILKRAVDL